MKRTAGFTLMEAVIALAVWMVLSVSVFFVWQNVSRHTSAVLERQSALENARVAMDALIINIQMARSIELDVGRNFDLREMRLGSYNADGNVHTFYFHFDCRLSPGDDRFQSMHFGTLGNEIASNLRSVEIWHSDERRQLDITITTGCTNPIVLTGSVDIRYKRFVPRQFG